MNVKEQVQMATMLREIRQELQEQRQMIEAIMRVRGVPVPKRTKGHRP